jgi:hypothetical protein
MAFLYSLARKQAAIFIVVMLVLVLVGAWVAFYLVHSLMK